MLKTDKKEDSQYAFLYNSSSPEAIYYKWKIISLSFGDSLNVWNETPFQLVTNGRFIIPPKCSSE